MPVRQRVGVSSTTIVRHGVIAAARPNPTKIRSSASSTQAPVGRTPISAALTAQIKVPVTIWSLRPSTSERLPQIRAPRIAPMPPP